MFQCRCLRSPELWISWSWSYRQLSWVLGTESGSSVRTVRTLNLRVIALALLYFGDKLLLCIPSLLGSHCVSFLSAGVIGMLCHSWPLSLFFGSRLSEQFIVWPLFVTPSSWNLCYSNKQEWGGVLPPWSFILCTRTDKNTHKYVVSFQINVRSKK